MVQRRTILSSLLVLILTQSTALATEPVISKDESKTPDDVARLLHSDFSYDYLDAPDGNFVDSVTMARLPPGSLEVRYEGLHKLIVKQANNQFRRLVRKYESPATDRIRLTQWDNEGWSTNEWWQRTWMDSLPSEKGGAPDEVYVHTIGSEIEWRLGPLSITNTLRVKLDYFAVLKLNTDPTTPEGEPVKARVAVDIYTPKQAVAGTKFKLKVRPHVRVDLMKAGDWAGFFRTLSLRAELDVVVRGVKLVKVEADLRYKRDNLRFEVNVELVSW